jgi:type VI secretion system protein VasD
MVAGCETLSGAVTAINVASAVLEATGVKKPANAPLDVPVTINAGNNLNASAGMPTNAVAKIYQLGNTDTWYRLSMEQMLSDEEMKRALGSDLISYHEIQLRHDDIYFQVEQIPKTTRYIGIAVFFHSPAPYRWKYAFETKQVSGKKGVSLAAHACALTVLAGEPVLPKGIPQQDPRTLASVKCLA